MCLVIANCIGLFAQTDKYENLEEYYLTYTIISNVKAGSFNMNLGLCEELFKNEDYTIQKGLAACVISFAAEGDTINAHKVINRLTPQMKYALAASDSIVGRLIPDAVCPQNKADQYNKYLADQYTIIFIEDQGLFKSDGTIILDEETTEKLNNQGYGHLLEEARNLPGTEINRLNLIKIRSLIAEYGIPSVDKVGHYGMYGIYLTILHSKLASLEEFDSFVKENFSSRKYGYMVDKKKVAKKLPQIYGTQGQYDAELQKTIFYEIEEPEYVDCRRMKIGLMPISHYAKNLSINEEDVPKQLNCK